MKFDHYRHHYKILILFLLTLPLQSPIALANPVASLNCLSPNCQEQIYAQRYGNKPRRRGAEKLMEQLDLSDTQIQQLNTVRQKYRPQLEELRKKIQGTRQELGQMIQGNASSTDLTKKHQELTNLDQKMHNLRFQSMLEMREILTPEQRVRFAQLMQQRRENRRNNRGNGN
ncbi:MAG TPA: hypothetical protein DCF68_10620 [Cyanothece sp. UBA12306]|nr:hypothetical protein [Cyanothece sp. UBA12306]